MSGSMSREWKRTVWQAPQARRTAPRHFLTLPDFAIGGLDARVIQPVGAFDNKLLCIMHPAGRWSAGRSGLSGPSCLHRLHCNEAR